MNICLKKRKGLTKIQADACAIAVYFSMNPSSSVHLGFLERYVQGSGLNPRKSSNDSI